MVGIDDGLERERSREQRLSMGLGSQRCGLDEARSRGGGLGMIDAGDWERQHRGATMAGIMASSREIGGL
ncbi:hypothetical protein M0R45_037440 [Rubus argutus]|uniref:Uncharacterized protein n=1 Tax=Rubus argutus TaxID=59490 RepID=A0AAW1W4H2_RUBAR